MYTQGQSTPIQGELKPDEKLLWSDRPNAVRYVIKSPAITRFMFGCLAFVIAYFVYNIENNEPGEETPPPFAPLIVGAILIYSPLSKFREGGQSPLWIDQ